MQKVMLLFGSLLLATGGPAMAAVTAIAGGNPSHIALTIPVTAQVATSCSFAPGQAPSGSFTNADIVSGFINNFGFSLLCNCPSRVAVQSANGGLLAPLSAPAGYTNLVPYQVTLNLVGAADVPTVSATCSAESLKASAAQPCSFRGPATANRGLQLSGPAIETAGSYLKVSAAPFDGSAIPVASNAYADTLTVTVSAAI